ncbi:MAG: hypothetical protein IPK13_13075 [Deltaproteobacteria bacterium]|nr:hypothetical protein [Deltaproteobacteria bacterium]
MNEAGPVLSGGNVRYELAGKTKAISHGGIGAIQRLVKKTGLTKHIDDNLIRTGRRIVYRLLAWNQWQNIFFRLLDAL